MGFEKIRLNPVIIGISLGYTVGCIPKSVYQLMKEWPEWHGQHAPN
ncbi:MAG: hypothetical protein AB8V21_04315 [Arsenophonus endosymbiont of Dermacentor nuttalli]